MGGGRSILLEAYLLPEETFSAFVASMSKLGGLELYQGIRAGLSGLLRGHACLPVWLLLRSCLKEMGTRLATMNRRQNAVLWSGHGFRWQACHLCALLKITFTGNPVPHLCLNLSDNYDLKKKKSVYVKTPQGVVLISTCSRSWVISFGLWFMIQQRMG